MLFSHGDDNPDEDENVDKDDTGAFTLVVRRPHLHVVASIYEDGKVDEDDKDDDGTMMIMMR